MGAVDAVRGAVYEIEGVRLDPLERRLERDGHSLALTPKAFDLLCCLVERAGRLVPKSTLLSLVWPDVTVEEANLSYQIGAVRKVLDTGRRESMIETVPTQGYRFVGSVSLVERREDDRKPAQAPGGRNREEDVPRRAALLFTTGCGAAVFTAVVLIDPAD